MFARQSLLSTVAAASASRRAAASFSTSAVRGDLARMQLVGRIVGPTEIKTAANGSEYALYTVATNDSRPSNAEAPNPPSYHRVYAFGDRVERVKSLEKGSLVFVEADFRLEKQPGENGQPARERLLAQHRSLQVLSKPRTAEAAQ